MKKTNPEGNTNGIISFETFRKFDGYFVNMCTQEEPSCFNGMLEVRKYKITIEPVEEPVGVIAERIQKLWDFCDNSHHWQLLEAAAKQWFFGIKQTAK